jgi:hypothetical protein
MATSRVAPRLVLVLVAMIVIAFAGIGANRLPAGHHGAQPPATSTPTAAALVTDLPEPLRVLPVDQDVIDATEARFGDATGAPEVGVVHAEVPGGTAPLGVVVVSMVMPRQVEGPAMELALVDAIARIAPLSGATRQLLAGRPEWVRSDDATLASSALIIDGLRVPASRGDNP